MQYVVFGIITGSILVVGTIGFALIRQTQGFINIAHGQYLTLGAFIGFVFAEDLGLTPLLSGVLTVVSVGVIGVLVARLVFEPVRERGALVLLFTSIGLAYALYGLILAIFGTDVRVYNVGFGPSYDLGSASITLGESVIIGLMLLIVGTLWSFLAFTPIGRSVRAVASNQQLARVRGIRTQLVSATVWFIAAGLAGLAGMLFGIVGSATAELGWRNILLVLAVAVIGGIGRIYSIVPAAMLIGLVMSLSALVIPTTYQTLVAFATIVLVLIVRPEGLFAVRRRKEQGAS